MPRAHVIGAVNQGWEIALTTLAHERGTGFAFKEQVLARIALDELIALARARGGARDPGVRQEVARGWIDVEIMRLMNCRTLTRLERGEEPGPESSLVKLFWAHLTQRLHELALELLGPEAQLAAGSRRRDAGSRRSCGRASAPSPAAPRRSRRTSSRSASSACRADGHDLT